MDLTASSKQYTFQKEEKKAESNYVKPQLTVTRSLQEGQKPIWPIRKRLCSRKTGPLRFQTDDFAKATMGAHFSAMACTF